MQVKRPRDKRQLLERLEAQRTAMRDACSALPIEEREARLRRAAADPFFFFRTYLPHYFTQNTPGFHRDLLREASAPGMNALAAPRGFGKSVLVTTAETLRRIIFTINPFQIIVKEELEAAVDEVAFIQLELEDNPRIIADFGKLKKSGEWEDGDFTTTNGCRVLARGRGQSVRGKRYRQHRPSRVVIDDPEKDQQVKNPRIIRELVDWVLQAVYPSMEPQGGILVWLGTLISRRGGLAMFQKGAGVNSRIWSAADEAMTTSLWEERFPIALLRQMRPKMGAKAWRTEMMNQPADDPEATFQDYMIHRYKPEELAGLKPVYFTAGDPSLEDTVKHDCKAVVTVALVDSFRGVAGPHYLVARAFVRHTTLEKFFAEFFNAHASYKPVRVGLETHSWQKLLKNDIARMEAARHCRLPLVGIDNKSMSKTARVGRLQPLMERGVLLFADTGDDMDMAELVEQFLGFDEPSIKDDGPDAVEMAVQLAERHGRKIGRVGKW